MAFEFGEGNTISNTDTLKTPSIASSVGFWFYQVYWASKVRKGETMVFPVLSDALIGGILFSGGDLNGREV